MSKRFDRLGNPIIKVNRSAMADGSPTKNKKIPKEDKKKQFKVTFIDKIEQGRSLQNVHMV